MGENIYLKVHDLLSAGQKMIFARTIRRSGSTPRNVGSMCIITEKGELFGTVGGGAMEYQVQQKAIELLQQEQSFIYRFQLSNEDLAKNGMICGGNVDLYLEPLFPSNNETLTVFSTIKQHIVANKPGILVTRIKDGIPAMDTGARIFIQKDGNAISTIPGLDPGDIHLEAGMPYDLIDFDGEKLGLFIEEIILPPRVFLFGAGHVAVFVARLAKMVGFGLTVIDDRQKFANKQNFPDADKIIVTDFDQAFEQLDISSNAYILIITRGHLHDKTVLEQALNTEAAYIGMIGSTKKRDTIYKALMENGVSKETLETVYSPIGLDIYAETPEEIAVSIVGELIKKRAPKKKNKKLML